MPGPSGGGRRYPDLAAASDPPPDATVLTGRVALSGRLKYQTADLGSSRPAGYRLILFGNIPGHLAPAYPAHHAALV